jgi:tRNA(fMet)-specific endonuclease VapC
MPQYMLDTDICIFVIKNRPVGLRERFNQSADDLCISTITLGELQYGAENSSQRARNLEGISRFIARIDVLPFGSAAAVHYGQLRAELRRLGQPAGPFDMLIGAHARSEGLIMVTNNVREFARMPGLRIENWAEHE